MSKKRKTVCSPLVARAGNDPATFPIQSGRSNSCRAVGMFYQVFDKPAVLHFLDLGFLPDGLRL
ncbi:MAG TPA: hypothetical protein DEH15_11240 [Marinilabiliales bacterium]|nr:hypothetical protein [Marinilabiliales bacterium]HBY53004.1 hypothetical protein [Marinilabiliales bacterium]